FRSELARFTDDRRDGALHIGMGQELQSGLAEAGEMATVEALNIEDRVQPKSFIGKYMPFGIGARLPVDKAAERLDLGFKRCSSDAAQGLRQQAAHDDVAIFIVIF